MRRIWLLAAAVLWTTAGVALSADISLKISAKENWTAWGDYILGQDLKAGLESLGYSVEPHYIEDFYPKGHQKSSVDIYMHGFVPFNVPEDKNKINVLYLYYPLSTAQSRKYRNLKDIKEEEWYSLQTELWDFDVIAVSSPSYLKEMLKLGIKVVFAPQFTNAKKFFYDYQKDKAYDILFVGRPGYERISAKWALESGFDVALFGSGWQETEFADHFKGDYIDNNELHTYYASAKIVLNDTREDMKRAGFISNRVFDVTASGGFLISDYMKEIEEFYGDSIPMFKTKEELKSLIDYYLAHPAERAQKAQAAQAVTLKYFTNTAVAKNIMKAVREIKADKKGLDYNTLALKSPWGENSHGIGDYWLGLDLEQGLKESGFEVKNYYYQDGFVKDDFYKKAGNLLYLQFKYNHIAPEDEQKNKIMYLYFPTFIPKHGKFRNSEDRFLYNTDAFLNNELDYFDLIATPAKQTLSELKEKGYKTAFVAQFTNPDKFKREEHENLKTDLLFVGSTWYERVSAKYAAELEYDLAVYGLNWEGKIDEKYIKGNFIDNRELYKYYSSAKIVLSDHADDLGEMGLVINRIYDATATGTLVISKYSPYIEEIYGDSVPMFKDKKEFKTLVDYYLSHPKERKEKAKAAQKITLTGYTNKIIGKQFYDLFYRLGKEKQ